MEDDVYDLDFDLSKSMRYHAYRRSLWDSLDFWNKLITVVSGGAVLVSVIGDASGAAKVFAFLVAVVGTADILIGFSQRARSADALYGRFSRLLQEVVDKDDPTPKDIKAWRRQRLEIEMDEPTIIDLLERRCCADETMARGAEVRDQWVLNRCQIVFSQFALWPTPPKAASNSRAAPDEKRF